MIVNLNAVPDTGPPLALRLLAEIGQQFEHPDRIVEAYGGPTLVDLWRLATLLQNGTGRSLTASPGSRIAELLAQLPSGREFRWHVLSEFGQLI